MLAMGWERAALGVTDHFNCVRVPGAERDRKKKYSLRITKQLHLSGCVNNEA